MREGGQFEAARIQYEKALKKEPSNPVALAKLARTLISIGQFGEAVRALEMCVRENPNYGPAYMLLGEKMAEEGNWMEALRNFQESNAINPFNPEVHKNLSDLYGKLGEKEKSQSELGFYRLLSE
jgi:tetratricopeptide (TPR) repeat protein